MAETFRLSRAVLRMLSNSSVSRDFRRTTEDTAERAQPWHPTSSELPDNLTSVGNRGHGNPRSAMRLPRSCTFTYAGWFGRLCLESRGKASVGGIESHAPKGRIPVHHALEHRQSRDPHHRLIKAVNWPDVAVVDRPVQGWWHRQRVRQQENRENCRSDPGTRSPLRFVAHGVILAAGSGGELCCWAG
jgi:hypothetical protein